jgi:predicted ATPase/DNA-binding SARP family transcriptional activator
MDTHRPLEVSLLGGFRLRCGDQPVKGFAQARLQHLLAYLVLHRRTPVSRQQIAFAFWPDTSDEQARSNLRTLLHRLLEGIPAGEGYLDLDRSSIRWRDHAALRIDVADFEDALARAGEAARAGDQAMLRRWLEAAVNLYAGDLLPDCYDDWVLPIRERLSQVALQATERLVLLLEEEAEYRTAIEVAGRLLRHDPLHEAAYRHLMRLHALCGDRVGVVRTFNACKAVLRRELDVPPADETRATYRQALDRAALEAECGQIAPPRHPPLRSNLPQPTASLIGREQETAHLSQLLEAHRLVTLTGSGGVGKTSLALHVAGDLQAAFEDGAWWVDLEPVADEAFVSQTVAETLGVREAPGGSTTQALAERLRDRHLLLVLDNCEHLVVSVAPLAQTLLRSAPRLHLLVTSQQALGLPGEIAWRIPSLATPRAESPQDLADAATLPEFPASLRDCPSVNLFIERAQAALPSFELTAANAGDVAAICRRVDGIPLAIELAAARTRTLTPRQITARLDDALALLARPIPGGGARHQTLRATIEWSHGLLSAREQTVLRRLAVFAGGFTLDAAEAVCSCDRIGSEQVLDLLAGLEDKSLLESTQIGGPLRFRLHEIIRQHADGKLDESGEAERLRDRHLEHYARLVAQAEPYLAGPDQGAWLDRLEAEHDNLRAALEWSLAKGGGHGAGLEIAGGLLRFWTARGHFREGRRWTQALVEAAPASPPTRARLKALGAAGHLAYLQGDLAQARAHGEAALAGAQALGDQPAIAHITHRLGSVAHAQGDCSTAMRCFESSLALHREAGDRWGEAATLANLGLATGHYGDPAAARRLLEECLDLRRRLGDEAGIAYALNALGDVALSEGRIVEARSLNEEALRMSGRLGDKPGIARSLDSLAVIAAREGDGARARTLFGECLLLYRELGDKRAIAGALDHLAGLLAGEGQAHAATQLMAAAAAQREAIGAVLPPSAREAYDRELALVSAALGDESFRAASTLGRAMTSEQAVRRALEVTAL